MTSVLGVYDTELSTSPLRDSSEWARFPAWMVAVLAVAGVACYLIAVHARRSATLSAESTGRRNES